MFHRTLTCLRRAQITIPQLSPTHTRGKLVKWCIDPSAKHLTVESYDPLFVLRCSPDLVTEGFRQHQDHEPLMIVEAHDEGKLTLLDTIELDKWYEVGTEIGEIDDGDDDEYHNGDWLWQAYAHEEQE